MGLASKIKSHWKLDEDESGGVGKDANSTYDLTDRNTVTSATGKAGKCIFATASSQENVYHSDDDYFDLADGFGFSFWLKTESSFDGSSSRRALTKRNQFEVWKTNAASGPDLKIKVNKASGHVTTTVKSSLTTSEWIFLYFAVDGSNFRYSVNGESLQTGGAMTDYNTAAYSFEVGNWSGTGNTTKFWNGEVDELSYWGELLTDAELTSLYAGGDGISFPFDSLSVATRNTVRIYTDVAVSSCSGSGPTYTVNYGSSVANVQIGDVVTVYKRGAGDGGSSVIVSTYTYHVTGITDSDTLTLTYITDSDSDGDDSPCDLPSGTGSSGSPNKAPHIFDRNLGSAFLSFVH